MPTTKKLNIRPVFLLLLILIIAGFFRLYNLNLLPPGLYPDEAMNGNNALEALNNNDFKIFYPENNGREGLFINIQAFFINIFGRHPWALRLASSLFGILTVWGLYLFIKELFFEKSESKTKKKIINRAEIIALLSSFFLATSFWHINFSRIGFRAIMAPFFLTWGIYFLLKAYNNLKINKYPKELSKQPATYGIFAMLGGVFYGLGFHSYIAYRATPIILLVIIFIYLFKFKAEKKLQTFWIATAIFTFVSIMIALPLGIYFLNHPADFMGRTSQISVFSMADPIKVLGENVLKTIGMFNVVGDFNWRHNLSGRPELSWPTGIAFVLGLGLGIITLFKKLNKKKKDSDNILLSASIILFTWLIVTALPVVISSEGLPHALRAIIMIPAIFAFAGIGGYIILNFIEKRFSSFSAKVLIVSFWVILIIAEAYCVYFILWGKNINTQNAFSTNYITLSNIINSMPNNQPKYIIIETDGVNVRGIPMPTQTIMFLTDTFTPEKQANKKIYYILPSQASDIPLNSFVMDLR